MPPERNTRGIVEVPEVCVCRLLGLAIERVNQVWCSDITYVPMTKGFLYLVVIMDWVSRAVLAVTNIEHTRRRFLRRGTR